MNNTVCTYLQSKYRTTKEKNVPKMKMIKSENVIKHTYKI